MCVTNTSRRRNAAISLSPAQVSSVPSVISQRLLGGFSSVPTVVNKPIVQYATPSNVPAEKPRPKRRRKPQKPGKTAKMNERHFVIHNYHDHANDPDETDSNGKEEESQQRRRGGVAVAFPLKLHAVLDQVEADGLGHIVSWQPHGRSFVVHKPKDFVELVMPRYFRQTKLTSFQRQLNLYGFSRLTRGADAGGYYHELFLRNKVFLCKKMSRTKVKGTRFKAASSPEQEPDFYKMNPVAVSPHPSSDEEMSFDSQRSLNSLQESGTLTVNPSVVESSPPAASISYEPLPIRYLDSGPPRPGPVAAPVSFQPVPMTADKIFDEAVDELFLDEAAGDLSIDEFVQDWDPTVNMEPMLQDDTQLGFLLEKILADE